MYLNPKGRIKIKSIADDKKKQSIVCYSPLIVVFVFTSVNGLWILFGKIKKNPPKIYTMIEIFLSVKKLQIINQAEHTLNLPKKMCVYLCINILKAKRLFLWHNNDYYI